MKCIYCESENNFVQDLDSSSTICTECGVEQRGKVSSPITFVDYSEYSMRKVFYKRSNYLGMLITQINSTNFKDKEILEKIRQHFIDNPQLQINYLNVKHYVNKHCKNVKNNKICGIINSLNNIRHDVINSHMMEQIQQEFKNFERYFNQNGIEGRKKKFIGYNFLLHKIFKKLHYQHLDIYIIYPMIIHPQIYKTIWKTKYKDFFYQTTIF